MDDLDKKILAALRENSRESFTNIAERVGTSEATVRARMKRLADDKIIEKFTIRTGAGNVKAIVEITVESHVDTAPIARAIARWEDVENVMEVTGATDIIVVADCATTMELNVLIDRIRAVAGTKATRSQLVLKEY